MNEFTRDQLKEYGLSGTLKQAPLFLAEKAMMGLLWVLDYTTKGDLVDTQPRLVKSWRLVRAKLYEIRGEWRSARYLRGQEMLVRRLNNG